MLDTDSSTYVTLLLVRSGYIRLCQVRSRYEVNSG